MITLKTTVWHARLFLWSFEIWDGFMGSGSNVRMTGRTNLCHFMRTIFIAMPLVFLLHAAFMAFVLYVIGVFPVTYFGALNYGASIVVVGTLVGLYFGLCWLAQLKRSKFPAKQRPSKPPKEPRDSGFVFLIWEWIVAQHQRVCPIIKIGDTP